MDTAYVKKIDKIGELLVEYANSGFPVNSLRELWLKLSELFGYHKAFKASVQHIIPSYDDFRSIFGRRQFKYLRFWDYYSDLRIKVSDRFKQIGLKVISCDNNEGALIVCDKSKFIRSKDWEDIISQGSLLELKEISEDDWDKMEPGTLSMAIRLLKARRVLKMLRSDIREDEFAADRWKANRVIRFSSSQNTIWAG